MIEKEFPDVRLIRNPDNKGFGAANNIAIRLSNAKYVFCLNTDTLLLDNSVKQFFDYMENNPDVGACGGMLLDKNKNPANSIGRFPNTNRLLFSLFGLRFIFPNYYKKHYSLCKIPTFTEETQVNSITGADLFLRKNITDNLGAFDEQFFMYFEETDLCYRIQKSGYKVMCLPQIKIIHLEGKSTNSRKNAYHSSSMLLYYRKNVGIVQFYILKFLLYFRK